MRKLLWAGLVGAASVANTVLPANSPVGPAKVQAAAPSKLDTGTTNVADLPAMAVERMGRDFPNYRVTSATLRSNRLSVAITADNKTSGARGYFKVYVIAKQVRGQTVYFVSNATWGQ